MEELNSINFEVKTAKGRVVIDYWAPWCGPCKTLIPLFEKIAKESSNVKFFKVNVDDNPDIASKFSVMSIPTISILENGEEKDRIQGLLSEKELKDKISRL